MLGASMCACMCWGEGGIMLGASMCIVCSEGESDPVWCFNVHLCVLGAVGNLDIVLMHCPEELRFVRGCLHWRSDTDLVGELVGLPSLFQR